MMWKICYIRNHRSKYSSFMVRVLVRNKCDDGLQTQKNKHGVTPPCIHNSPDMYIYILTWNMETSVAYIKICTLWLRVLPAWNTSSRHASATFSYNNNNKWPGAGPVMSQWNRRNSARQRSRYLFCVLLNKVDKFVFKTATTSKHSGFPRPFTSLHLSSLSVHHVSCFYCYVCVVQAAGQWLMRNLKHMIASLSVLVSGWWL